MGARFLSPPFSRAVYGLSVDRLSLEIELLLLLASHPVISLLVVIAIIPQSRYTLRCQKERGKTDGGNEEFMRADPALTPCQDTGGAGEVRRDAERLHHNDTDTVLQRRKGNG